jgi:hypothetical protein
MNYVNQKIRDSAKGRNCTMNSPDCNHNPETTVWAHSNYHEHGKGIGLKSHDIFGFFSCSGCHKWYDGEYVLHPCPHRVTRHEYYQRAHDRSLLILVKDGVLK